MGEKGRGDAGPPMDHAVSYESLVHAVAGAVGGVTAMTLFYPLDTTRLRLQVDEKMKAKPTIIVMAEIIKEEGLPAVYRSWFPVISSLCCSNFVYFYTFNTLKKFWVHGQPSSNSKDLVMGFISGVVNVLVTTPLWVVNTRIKLQGSAIQADGLRPTNYTGILDGVTTMMREEGVRALWSGTCPSLLLVLNPAVNFMVYEGLKRQLLRGRPELLSLEVFVIGAIAKAIATMLTYPLQTVQSLLRFGHKKAGGQSGVLGSLRHMLYLLRQRVRTQGFLGLYKGLEAKLLQTILTSALMFLIYERIAGFMFRITGLVPRGRN